MLILPIVNKNRILNVEVKLKFADKVRTGVRLLEASESDVIVNGKKFSNSSFKDIRDDGAVLEFIRTNSLKYKRNYLITTRQEATSSAYDVYEVEQPPKRINDGLDRLYVSAVTDMRKEIPGNQRKGRYLSLEKLGVCEHITDEKVKFLQDIVRDVQDSNQWSFLFENAGVSDMVDTLDFMKHFDFTVVSEATILESDLQAVIEALKKINTRDARNLTNYYSIALSNRDLYAKLSNVHKAVYDKPLTLIQSKRQKQLVKSMGESSNGKAA